VPLRTKELIENLNPLLRGWGEYFKRAHEGSSTDSTPGSCGGFGRTDSSAGVTAAGDNCRRRRCTASTGLLTWFD
jgi:hypothetical protein